MFSTPSGATRATASSASGAFGQDGAGGGSFQKRNRRRARPSDSNQNNGDRGGDSKTPDRGDGGRQNSKRGRPDKKGQNGSHRLGQRPGAKWQALQDSTGPEEPLPNYSSTDESSPPPSRMAPPKSDDPFAKRIHDKLRKDGISPPRWPDRPGEASSSHEMAQFRELHEAYRRKARASLTRAGLIDDPEKRKRLSDAIEFKGICEDMCPEFEKITRITENDVNKPEKDRSTGVTLVRMMVKKLARSAAGQEAPLPMDVRSASALRRSLDYLIDEVLCDDENISSVHPFLWDRTRAIRRDFAFFSSMTEQELKTQVYVLENITRFHVTSLHLLSRTDQEDDNFVEQQELEQLGKTLLSLRDLYDDCSEQGIKCENEAEFRAYYLVFHGRDPSILETLQRQWKPELWRDSDEVRTAVSLVEALQSTQEFIGSRKDGDAGPLLAASSAQLSFFRIVEDVNVSYTMACFAECHFPHLRWSILATVKRALARPKTPVQDVTTAALNSFLRFDTVEEAIQFAQLHHFDFAASEQNPADPGSQFVMLTDRSSLPHVRLSHQFSSSLVERKRGQASLPSLIHSTVYEDAGSSQGLENLDEDEDGLFVRGDQRLEDKPSSQTIATELDNSSNAAPPAQAPQPSAFMPRKASPRKHPFLLESDTDDDDAPNGSTASQSQQRSNPFAAKPNPFGGSAAPESTTANRAPARLPTFEEVKSMDNRDFSSEMTASRYNSLFNKPAEDKTAEGAEKLSFASLAGSGTGGITANWNLAKPKANPFAPQAANNAMMNGTPVSENALPGKPNPFSRTSEPSDDGAPQASSQGLGSGQAKPNPFASLSTPENSAAFPPAKGPLPLSGAPGSVKPAELPAPTAASSQSGGLGLESGPTGQDASPRVATPPAPIVNGQTNALGPSAAASPLAFGAPTTATSSSANQPASSAIQGTTIGNSGPVHGDQPQHLAVPGPLLPSASVSGVPPVSLGEKAADAASTPSAQPPLAPAVEPVPASPPRDLLGDVNKWYVGGDNGLLDDFMIDSISRITKDAFDAFEEEVKEQERLEEEERINAEVEKFRVYNLRLKFFYRWKRNARQKRLREVGRKGREEMRAFYAARRAAEREAKKAAADARERATAPGKSEELINMVKSKRTSSREARESLLASGVLSGIAQEREAAKMIVNGDSRSSRSPSISSQSVEPSPTPAKEGLKTRALRKLYFGQPERFRRSLPAMSSLQDVPDDAHRRSNASSRWTLKAMGIVQLPDGTAVPETLANEMASKMPRYPRSAATLKSRRVSATDAIAAELQRFTPSSSWQDASSVVAAESSSPANKRKKPSGRDEAPMSGDADGGPNKRIMSSAEKALAESSVEASAMNKRKRPAVDDEETRDDGETDGNSHKRIMSDAEKIRTELRALRAELEEGTEWFRAQNERLRSESERGTSWRDNSM